jgi:hypothetical protein
MVRIPHDHDPVSLREYLKVRPKNESSINSLAASQQSIFTFGLLVAVIEAPVAEDMLVHIDQSGKLVMTTRRLIDIIHGWIARIEQTEPQLFASWFERAGVNLRLARSLMVLLTTVNIGPFEPLGDSIPSVVCFTAIIAEALVNAHARMIVRPPMPDEGFSWSMIWTPSMSGALRKELHADEWCPFTMEYLASTPSVSSLQYACNQDPLYDGRNHSACTLQSCAAYDIDTESYVPKNNRKCRFVTGISETLREYCKPALEQVIVCMHEDHVPAATLNHSGLETHKSTDIPYVAVSHTWADRLESTLEDGLYICQLQRLIAPVSTLRPGAAF